MYYYQTLVKNVPQLLTYQSQNKIKPGSLVQIPLGPRSSHGLIITTTPQPDFECLEIIKTLIPEAVSPLQIKLSKWMSNYYYASLQKCLQLFLPSPIWNNKIKLKKEQIYRLKTTLEESLDKCKTAPKQHNLIKLFVHDDELHKSVIKKLFSTSIINSLLKKEIIEEIAGEILNPHQNLQQKPPLIHKLNSEQKNALDQILNKWDRKPRSIKNTKRTSIPIQENRDDSPNTFLLHGITGSGKTEIYLQLIKYCIQKDQQCLLLVPEIALTTELIGYFTDHLPDQISIIHSKLSEGERVQNWHRIHQEKTKLILGSRSALFTPWKKLGLIIIDEEHEWTYKQEQSPRYHIKTVTEKLVSSKWFSENKQEKPLLISGSATPSIESFHQSIQSNSENRLPTTHYQLLTLSHRATKHPLPPVKIVDLRDEYKKKNFSMFSEQLQEALQKRLDRQEQSILFLNKRGSASSITCRDCGFSPKCPNCDITLTFHQQLQKFKNGGLICHYCGYFSENLRNCPHCQSVAIKHIGSGTQKAELQLRELFPTAKILRADKDTTSGRYDFEQIYQQMKTNKADMLLGTQMISKGLDLPNVTLTGIIIADIGLHLPDFRASERIFQLLMQVAGRSGRHKAGEVIIQTYQPDHPAIQAAKNHDFQSFYQQEIDSREQNFYSPFSKSIKLIYADENSQKAYQEAQKLYVELSNSLDPKNHKNPTIDIAPHYIPRLHGKFIWNILIRASKPREILEKINLGAGWKVDVDPL